MCLLLLLALGCGRQRTHTASAAADDPVGWLVGEWVVALSEDEAQELEVYTLALDTTIPGEAELRGRGLDDADLQLLYQLRALPRGDQRLEQLAVELARMETASLIITDSTMRMLSGARQEEVGWSVIAQEGNELTVRFEEGEDAISTGTILLGDEGTLTLIDREGRELTFRRAD